MILLTGGAGFIGSCVNAALQDHGYDVCVVDWLGHDNKWRNLQSRPPQRLLSPERLSGFLAKSPEIEAVIHLGAVSETTADDGDLVWRSNVGLSQELWRWCAFAKVHFIYASSAATYGAASSQDAFLDDMTKLDTLRPMNLYGWSKHAFDLWVRRQLTRDAPAPLHWTGLKFFNVYGPNEYHKGGMISVVKKKYDDLASGNCPQLFRSDRTGLADGEQKRDFIWVGDVVDVILWLLGSPVSGLFNVGTGVARSYLDLAHAVCDAAGVERKVAFIDMPSKLRGRYQSYTCADMSRLRAAGYCGEFASLENGVRQYVDRLRLGDIYI